MSGKNPLLEELDNNLPGVTVTLPTMGRFYRPGVLRPDANPASLVVKPFTLWQEIQFRDPYKVVSGKAVETMVAACCPDVLKPSAMMAIDVDAIMIAARIASYGNTIDITIKCSNPKTETKAGDDGIEKEVPVCDAQNEYRIDLARDVAPQYVDVGSLESWQVELPNGQIVQLAPQLYRTAIDFVKSRLKETQLLAEAKKVSGDEDATERLRDRITDDRIGTYVDYFRSSILSVVSVSGNVVTDRKQISEWLDRIPTQYFEQISTKLDKMMEPIAKMGTVSVTCSQCGHVQDGIPVNGDVERFFGRSSRP